jgi:phosphonatase-like hydrolase
VGETIDATVTSDEVAQGRPFPDMIFRAMELTGVTDVKRVAKVGDTPSDLGEGMAAGCGWVVGVTGGSHTREELLAHPHTHLIPSIAQLPVCLDTIPSASTQR